MMNMSTELAHYDFNSLTTHDKKYSLKTILQLEVTLEGESLGLFLPENRVRQFCSEVTKHWFF